MADIRFIATDAVYHPLSVIYFSRELFLRDLGLTQAPNLVVKDLKVYDLAEPRPLQP